VDPKSPFHLSSYDPNSFESSSCEYEVSGFALERGLMGIVEKTVGVEAFKIFFPLDDKEYLDVKSAYHIFLFFKCYFFIGESYRPQIVR
jgi:hypothetical protein